MRKLLALAGAALVSVLVAVNAVTADTSNVSGVFGGTVALDLQAGTVRAQVNGLTKSFGGYGYIGWLVNEATGAKLNTGLLSTAGVNEFTGANLAAGGYTAYVVTFETTSNTSNTPAGDPVAKAPVVARGTSPIGPLASGTVDVSDTSLSARVKGLAKLPPGFEYVGWLVNEATSAKLNVGVLSADGVNTYTGSGLARGGYTAYVVTYEPVGNRSNTPAGEPVAKAPVSIAAQAPVSPARAGDGSSLTSADDGGGAALYALIAGGALLAAAGGVATLRRVRARS